MFDFDNPQMGELYQLEENISNCSIVDYPSKKFNVLGLLELELPHGFDWYISDYVEEDSIGAVFRTWGIAVGAENEDNILDVGYIAIVDATKDTTEPNICDVTEENVSNFDNHLKEDLTEGLSRSGRCMKRWMSSQLNETADRKALVTAYITSEDDREMQYIFVRISVNKRKIVIIGRFDIAHAELIAKPIYDAMREITLISTH